MPAGHLQPQQKDFKQFDLYANQARSTPSAINANALSIGITKLKMSCGHCPSAKLTAVFDRAISTQPLDFLVRVWGRAKFLGVRLIPMLA